MKTDEIVKLTREGIAELLSSRAAPEDECPGHERRKSPRWPFPGAVELRPVGANDDELCFGSCRDLSQNGVGLICDDPFETGTPLDIALHLPEASFCGKATVRYCAQIEGENEEEYVMGLEFDFDD